MDLSLFARVPWSDEVRVSPSRASDLIHRLIRYLSDKDADARALATCIRTRADRCIYEFLDEGNSLLGLIAIQLQRQ